jgi:Tfp pilus assembly protein PilX
MNKIILKKIIALDKKQTEGGWFLVTVLVITLFLTTLGLAIMAFATTNYQVSRQQLYIQNAQLTAEAGIEQTIAQLNQNSSFAGYPSATEFFDNSTQGYGAFTTTIASMSGNPNGKVITSTGKVYNYNDTTQLMASYAVQVTTVGTSASGYSVITGPGGLILSGSGAVTNSTLYVNGYINMSGGSSIGTQSSPSTVYVADDWCPQGSNPGSTFPSVCSSSVQPITLGYSTYIYGSVCATNQTSKGPNGNEIQPGNGGQGLEVGCTANPISPPYYDWQTQESSVTTVASGTSGQYACSGSGTVTIPANTELTGSNITWGNSCNYDILGNVYIPGNLTINGASQVSVSNSLGSTMPVVLVGGTINVDGSATILENSDKTGIDFISIDSNAPCDSSCTSITGTDLYNTMTFQTVKVGGAAQVQGSIFDAYWGEVTLDGSGIIGGAAGQTINMSGAGTITFGTELDSGSTTWTITSYEPIAQ